MADPDYRLALKLQEEYNKEINELKSTAIDLPLEKQAKKQAPKRRRSIEYDLNSTQNLVHPEWETLDPTPDVHSMFSAFDNKFFQGRLKCVVLEWSKRMYSCAGICYSKRNAIGMSITIRLSEPLLKLRPRKNLIETLLHEMIHAYCFVLGIREGNGGHGPNFQKIMHGINKVAGTNITVYHTFSDEVDLYKVHWWRCNGICQHRKPFYGYVKRTSNRAPSANDFWWRGHMESCGGTFLKIKGPEPKKKKSKKELERIIKNDDKKITHGKDIRNFFDNSKIPVTPINTGRKKSEGTINGLNNFIKGPIKTNGGGTLLLNPKTKTATVTTDNNINVIDSHKSPKTGGNLKNVVGLNDLDESSGTIKPKKDLKKSFPVSDKGYSLNSHNISTPPTSKNDIKSVDHDKLREIWSKKFPQANPCNQGNLTKSESDVVVLINEPNQEISNQKSRRKSEEWEILSDDICIKSVQPEIIDLSDDDESDYNEHFVPAKSKTPLTQQERQVQIKKEIADNSELSEDDIELIDDDYDDALSNSVDLTDTSLVDDFFGDDVLLKEFKIENSLVPCGSRSFPNPNKDIVTCPICQSKVTREHFEDHLDGCIGISIKIQPKSYGGKIVQGSRGDLSKKPKINKKQENALRRAGYSEKDISNMKVTFINTDEIDSDDEKLTQGRHRRKGLTTSTHPCPECGNEVDVDKIDYHLKICTKHSPFSPRQEMRPPKTASTPNSITEIPFQFCPVCNKRIKANVINEHLDLCLEEFNDDF